MQFVLALRAVKLPISAVVVPQATCLGQQAAHEELHLILEVGRDDLFLLSFSDV